MSDAAPLPPPAPPRGSRPDLNGSAPRIVDAAELDRVWSELASIKETLGKLRAGEVGAIGTLGLLSKDLVEAMQHPGAQPTNIIVIALVLAMMLYTHRRGT